jgi:hypothetical protein
LRDCFPKDKTTPITIQHGELLAAWCASAGGAVTTPKVIDPPQDELKALKLELWAVLKPIRNPGEKTWDTANDWLWAEEILDAAKEPVERAPDLTVEKFREVIKAAKQKLEKGQLS